MAKKIIDKKDDSPVTHKELAILKKMISSVSINMDHKFKGVNEKFENLRKEVKLQFDEMRLGFREQSSHIDVRFHQIMVLVEEQNSANKAVFDGQAILDDRTQSLDVRLKALEKTHF